MHSNKKRLCAIPCVAGLFLVLHAPQVSAQQEIISRPADAIRTALETGNAARQKGVLLLIPEMSLKGPEAATTVTTLEAYLRRTNDAELQALALAAYGKLGPTAVNAAKVLQPYIRSPNPRIQQSAVQAVSSSILASATEFSKSGSIILGDADTASAVIGPALTELWLKTWRRVVSARHREDFDLERFSDDCKELLPLYATALRSNDADAQRFAAEGLMITSQALGELFANAEVSGDGPARIEPGEILRRTAVMQPAFAALNDVAPGLKGAFESAKPATRLAAVRAADSIGMLRRRTQAGLKKPAEDPLMPALKDILPSAVRMLDDESPEIRLTAAEAIEQAGPDARDVLSSVIRASRSNDLFVRWVSTRTLGKILARKPDGGTDRIVAALTERVGDSDLDIVAVALTSLAKGKSESQSAIDTVIKRAAKGDPDTCIQAIYTLGEIDADRTRSVAGLIPVLQSESSRIRRAVVTFMGKSGKSAREALQPLSALLADPDEEVRKEAARAILLIVKNQ